MDIYNRKQEIVNSLIHGIGILFGVSGLPVLTGIATAHGNTPGIIWEAGSSSIICLFPS